MILLEPHPTPYDLRFGLFGVSVRVHPMFWLLTAFTGWPTVQFGLEFLLAWIACVFISVLVHELGHIFMGRLFGSDGYVVLYGFGGLAVGSSALSNRWKRIAVYLAGPGAGFLYLGVMIVCLGFVAPNEYEVVMDQLRRLVGLEPENPARLILMPTLTDEILGNLVFINLFWGIMNLLPIWPLDGGQISRDLATWISRHNGLRASLGISLVVAGLIAVHALMADYDRPLIPFLSNVRGRFVAIMFGFLALESYMHLQQESQKPWREDYPAPWDPDQHN